MWHALQANIPNGSFVSVSPILDDRPQRQIAVFFGLAAKTEKLDPSLTLALNLHYFRPILSLSKKYTNIMTCIVVVEIIEVVMVVVVIGWWWW